MIDWLSTETVQLSTAVGLMLVCGLLGIIVGILLMLQHLGSIVFELGYKHERENARLRSVVEGTEKLRQEAEAQRGKLRRALDPCCLALESARHGNLAEVLAGEVADHARAVIEQDEVRRRTIAG